LRIDAPISRNVAASSIVGYTLGVLKDRERASIARRARSRFRRSRAPFRRVFSDALGRLGFTAVVDPERLPAAQRARFFDVMGTIATEYAMFITGDDALHRLRLMDRSGGSQR
jgi:hypothetical protein